MPHAMQLATTHLAAHDPVLAPIINRVGPCTITPHQHYYKELVEAIIGQQLSIKAAATITRRFAALFDEDFPSPQAIIDTDTETLRTAGLSRSKVAYVKDLAQHILDGSLRIDHIVALNNDEIIRELTAVKGIGEWTAHMFLIFSLGRLDVLPVGDLGLRNGVQRLYGLSTLPIAADLHALAKTNHWHPFESVAAWYVWQSLALSP